MRRRTLALALTIALPAAASAGTLTTLPAAAFGSPASLGCLVQNLDAKEHVVTARLFDQGGFEVDEHVASVDPGAVITLVVVPTAIFGAYCQFEGLGRKVRGFLHVVDATGTVVLLPAQK